ncbi:hypothetical protein B0J14DRAFT_668623 [Halenospora varia]|nr:hypothetical protein B0J14DRAFT_668623 [Halenospora varia]
MSASSFTASGSLSRSRAAILLLATVAAAYGSYYIYTSAAYDAERDALPGPGLRRSNAVHHRRRRGNASLSERPATGGHDIEDVQNENDMERELMRSLTDGDTVVDDQAFDDEWNAFNNNPLSHQHQRNGQNIVQLLFRVSEDATRRNAYVHRGCACNSCGIVPIRGIRYRCSNCADYDLCESCESQCMHTKTHVFYKIRVPGPSFGPKNIQPVWYAGDPDSVTRLLPKEITTKLSRETGLERPELDAYWEQWTFMANTDWREDPDDINLAMDRKTFERCLVPSSGYRHTSPSLIFDRMFAFYDTNKDDLIGFSEFLQGIGYRKRKDKWSRIFDGYDIDGDGYVDRKDFLRMFRSYYVLYRQMHRDMLEGMEEQHMSTSDAHRLVTSRQPLSSAFGQDGRYPQAPSPHTGEGKSKQSYGDMEIVDGKGVMRESSSDTGSRDDVFRQEFMMLSHRHQDARRVDRNRLAGGYWETLTNPPRTEAELARVVQDITTIQADLSWLPHVPVVTDEDAAAIDGPGTSVADVKPTSRNAVIQHAHLRAVAQGEIYDRWKRRQFYTDEEEGATPPADWKEDDDVMAQFTTPGESSKSPARPSIHSRSSSKVRFAEDMDDFDTRSNPSTSSRSVPERWGGIEIPDAERDAGKEILYQVTQQAFNELLDPFFKEKEDLALQAAANKSKRDKYRPLFATDEFEKWALEREADLRRKEEDSVPRIEVRRSAESATNVWPTFPEVEIEEVREIPLENLLAETGYQLAPEPEEEETPEPLLHPDFEEEGAFHPPSHYRDDQGAWHPPASIYRPDEEEFRNLPPPPPPPTDIRLAPVQASQESSTHGYREAGRLIAPLMAGPHTPINYRDPTMPQFRPNTLPPTPKAERINKLELYQLWRCDDAADEAKERGGWGRLDYDEFERLVKKFVREGKGNQMDYLGSWIDLCIP